MDYWIDTDQEDQSRALVTSFLDDSVLAAAPVQMRSDTRKTRLFFLKRTGGTNQQLPFSFILPATYDAVRFGGGELGSTPTGGTFTLTDPTGAQTTAALAFGISAAALQVAIRAALTTNFALAVVTGSAGGPWTIDRGATGAFADITGSGAALVPSVSTVVIDNSQQGNGSLNEMWTVALAKALPILNTTWGATDAAAVSITTSQIGSATQNKVFRLSWNADAYGGAINLIFTGDGVTSSILPIPFNANADDIAASFAVHTKVLSGGVSVVRNGPCDFTIACIGSFIDLSNAPTLAEVSNTLLVPVGLQANVSNSTAGCDALLGTSNQVTITTEIEVFISGNPNTLAQLDGYLRKDLIRNTPGQNTGNEDWVKATDLRVNDTLRVDKTYGNNTTGTREYPATKPFATIQAAINASVNGDTIFVEPGTYDEVITTSFNNDFIGHGVQIGATIAGPVVIDGGDSARFYGRWSFAPANTTQVAILVAGGGTISIEEAELYGRVNISSGTFALNRGTSSVTSQAAVTVSGGTVTLENALLTGGDATSLGVDVSGGVATLSNMRVDALLASSGNPILKSGGTLTLKNDCVLLAHASRDSISAPSAQNVKIYGTVFANKAKDADVTIQVGTLIVDTLVT